MSVQYQMMVYFLASIGPVILIKNDELSPWDTAGGPKC